MINIVVNITFSQYYTHQDVVASLQPIYQAKAGEKVLFLIDLNTPRLVYGDYLVLIVAAINYLSENGITYDHQMVNFDPNSDSNRYISRIDFFKLVGFSFYEQFERRNSEGRFTEIARFDGYENADDIHTRLIKILNDGTSINRSTLEMLQYSLWEVIDNVLNHSESDGYCHMQLFPKRKEIRLIVADKGVGIHNGLTAPIGSNFKHLREYESIIECTRKGVTNGNGLGNGLYHTAEFVKHNAGQMVLHSGSYLYQRTAQLYDKVLPADNWKGTYLFMLVKTDIDVDHKKIIGTNSTLDNNFDFLFCD